MVNSLQRRGSFHASLSARNRGDSEGWRGDGKPGLEGKGKHELPEWANMSVPRTQTRRKESQFAGNTAGRGSLYLIVRCHDQCSGSSRLRLAAGYWQGCRQAGHQGAGCL